MRLALLLLIAPTLLADPWIETRDANLRADIERLSSAGVITVPINTWPLMWSGIIEDIDGYDQHSEPSLRASYQRVMAASKKVQRSDRVQSSIKLSLANDSQLMRHYGDDSRDQRTLTVRRMGITENFAYNLEVAKVTDPWDGDKTIYDNSYFGFVLGNWIGVAGNIEKWWGPGWNSSLLLTNNARPTPGLTLQRNYSDASELPILNWLGPWTTNLFISKLDDERVVDDAKLVGMTLGFRPTASLEINLRRTAQWGGQDRPQGFQNFFRLVTGISDNCETVECRLDEPGNQLGAIDISWNMPWVQGSLYAQTLGEDESGALPSRSSRQYGFKKGVDTQYFNGMVFVEHDNTSTVSYSNHYNILYNHGIYRTGYRYQGRVIGATWDNDSKVNSLGIVGFLTNGDAVEARYSRGDLNIDSINGAASRHSITTQGATFSSVSAKWRRSFLWGQAEIQGRYTDKLVDEFGRQERRLRIGASLTYEFD